MTTKVLVTNYTPMGGKQLEVSVFTKGAPGLTPENAKERGVPYELVPIAGEWAVKMSTFNLAPGEHREIWVHDLQFFMTRELP